MAAWHITWSRRPLVAGKASKAIASWQFGVLGVSLQFLHFVFPWVGARKEKGEINYFEPKAVT